MGPFRPTCSSLISPGDGAVHVNLRDLVPLLFNALTADPHLVLDRGRALEVRTEPGIDCSAHVSPLEWLRRDAGN
jgi:hypothetical protein